MITLLQANNLSKTYGAQKIFERLSFSVTEKQKLGVIGRNGSGKTTLCRIILGQETVDSGELFISSTTRLGFINQQPDWLADDDGLSYLSRQTTAAIWTIKKEAAAFGFSADSLAQPISELSGGWQMRLKVVAAFLRQPNLLILDEPTNYLDLATLLLLENQLKLFKGALLVVSHDREFLKNVCDNTLEISRDTTTQYSGGLEDYLAFKASRHNSLLKINAGLIRQQEHLQDFADRFRAKASKAKQAQAALRKIKKLESKRITIEHAAGITRINLPTIPKRHNAALKIKRLTVGYEQPLIADIELELNFGERLAVLGVNGSGKSTLLKTLAGRLEPLSGSYHWFTGGRLAYYAQDSDEHLSDQQTVGDYLRSQAGADTKTETVLKMAGDFLFDENALLKPVQVLSGGEKSRLILAGILLSAPDMLLLDEPNSHLDFATVEALANALANFAGALLFVSHDRTFSNLLATGLIEVANGQALRRWHSYENYVANLREPMAIAEAGASTNNDAADKHQAYRQWQRKLAAAEKRLAKLNQRHAELMYYFREHHNYQPDKVRELDELNNAIRQAEDEWLELSL